jgi:hypothetical protein
MRGIARDHTQSSSVQTSLYVSFVSRSPAAIHLGPPVLILLVYIVYIDGRVGFRDWNDIDRRLCDGWSGGASRHSNEVAGAISLFHQKVRFRFSSPTPPRAFQDDW